MRKLFIAWVLFAGLFVSCVWFAESNINAGRIKPKEVSPAATAADYQTYLTAISAENDAVVAEEQASAARDQAQADLDAAQAALDAADVELATAKADTDAAHQATDDAYQAVRP
jgi:multidrug efflux pump subunit AcrA (membrane-fusion protein)